MDGLMDGWMDGLDRCLIWDKIIGHITETEVLILKVAGRFAQREDDWSKYSVPFLHKALYVLTLIRNDLWY
jgi:hypothetical protein